MQVHHFAFFVSPTKEASVGFAPTFSRYFSMHSHAMKRESIILDLNHGTITQIYIADRTQNKDQEHKGQYS